MASDLPPLIVSTKVLAGLLKVGARRVQQLHQQGVFPSSGHGQWDAMICVPAGTQNRLENEMARVAKTPAEERIRDAKAALIELRVAEQTKRLVKDAEEHFLDFLDEVLAPLKPDLLGIPARATKDLALRRTLEREIEGALTRAADRMKVQADKEDSHGRR